MNWGVERRGREIEMEHYGNLTVVLYVLKLMVTDALIGLSTKYHAMLPIILAEGAKGNFWY